MGLFSTTFQHPEFGSFTKGLFGMWKGRMSLQNNQNVEVRLPGSGREPEPRSFSLLKDLTTRYPDLQKEIEKYLYEHYEPYREAVDTGEEVAAAGGQFPRINLSSDVWKSTKPVRVAVDSMSKLEIAFEVEWDEEHIVGATIDNWNVVDFCGSVGP